MGRISQIDRRKRDMRKKIVWGCSVLAIILFIATGWFFLLYQSKENLPVSCGKEDLIRLHVLANSDSAADQALKLKVRDAIITYLAPYLEHTTQKIDAEKIVFEHKDQLTQVAEEIIAMNGANYPVDLQLGMFDFPIKSYGNLVLPAGKYEAVRILIGKAEGKNWWCVLFPPLCFVDITNATAISPKVLRDNSENQEVTVEFKSKFAELWRELQN